MKRRDFLAKGLAVVDAVMLAGCRVGAAWTGAAHGLRYR